MNAKTARAILIAAISLCACASLAQTKSKDAAAYANRGIAKFQKNDLDGAIADFNRALQFDPKLAAAFLDRGMAKQAKGDFQGAISDYDRAIVLNPRSAKAYNNRGLAKKQREDLIFPGNVHVLAPGEHAGTAKAAKADLQEAITDFNRALQLDPKNAGIYDNRGAAKAHKGDLDGAISDYNRALDLNPKLAGGYLDRGNAKDLKGDHNGAIADYNRALELDPKLAGAYVGRGAAEVCNGDAASAIADCNRALQLNPRLVIAYQNRAYANFLARNWADSLRDSRHFCELSKRHQEYVRLHIWLLRSRLGDRPAADRELAADFYAEPRSWPCRIRAYLLSRLSEREFLAAASSDAEDSSNARYEAWFFAGMKNLLDGNKSTAIEFFKKCVGAGQRGADDYAFAKSELMALEQ